MHYTKCKVCEGQTSEGIWMCDECAGRLKDALVQVPDLIEELDITISRQSQLPRDENTGSKGTKKVHAPMPIDVDASEAATLLGRCILSWHAALGFIFSAADGYQVVSVKDPAYLPQRTTKIIKAARAMSRRVDYIKTMEVCGDVYTEVMSVCSAATKSIDHKPKQSFYGVCRCGSYVYERPGIREAVCRSCGIQLNLLELQDRLRDRIADTVGTSAEIAGLLRLSGYECAGSTVRRWGANGKIAILEYNSRNNPVYSYAECLNHLLTLHPEQKKQALSA